MTIPSQYARFITTMVARSYDRRLHLSALLLGFFPTISKAWLSQPIAHVRRSTTQRLATTTPCLSGEQLQELKENKYLIVPAFIPESLQQSLRQDVEQLRSQNYFKVAKIGQDSTNMLNTKIRVAETCFLGKSKKDLPQHAGRQELYERLDRLRTDLGVFGPLDDDLTELLYAYYPQGGFYRRHRDAIPGSASVLRTYSMLLYLNKDWNSVKDAGQLRLHFDSGGDELPPGESPFYKDVDPEGGTLVIFQSDAIPHEVLDTQKKRIAVVGWFNRPMSASDIATLSEGSPMKMVLLSISAALMTAGILGLVT
jgi:SM-20-related protein